MLIIALIGMAISQDIVWSNYSFPRPEFINLIAQTNFARSFEEFGQILNISIQYDSSENESFCHFEFQYLIFNQIESTLSTFVKELQQFDIDELETKDIEQGYSNQLISYAKSDLNLLLLERNGIIHYLNFDENSKLFNSTKFNLSIYSDTKQHQMLLRDNDAFYYINSEQFSRFIVQNMQLYQFEIQNWNRQYEPFKIQIKNNYVFLINEQKYLFVYKIVEHNLIFQKKFSAEDIYYEKRQMNLVDIIIQDQYLYILDHENGVKRLILGDYQIDDEFFIQLPGCSIISIEKETLILIQHYQQRSIVYEGIIKQRSWTLLQTKQTSKKIIKYVKQLNNYAILMSNPINSIHRKYMIESISDKQMIRSNDFYQMDFLGMEKIDQNYLIGIFKYGIALYYVLEQPSTILCSSQMPSMSRIEISLISTQCPNQNKSNQLNYCSSKLEYIFDIRGALMNELQEQIFIYLSIGAIIIVTLLVVSIIYIIRRYQLKKELIIKMKKNGRIKPK